MDHQPDTAAATGEPTLKDFYHRQYGVFAADVSAVVRQDIYGEEFGQSNWQTVEEYARFFALRAPRARRAALAVRLPGSQADGHCVIQARRAGRSDPSRPMTCFQKVTAFTEVLLTDGFRDDQRHAVLRSLQLAGALPLRWRIAAT